MKLRQGFVSNSSSSSFVINMDKLNAQQIEMIHSHMSICKSKEYFKECNCPIDSLNFKWQIFEDENNITGSCDMDNFDMALFLELIGVKDEDIEWSC